MPNYQQSKIYTIRCKNDDTLIYVGSTTQPLSHRWGGHKKSSKKQTNRLIYKTINGNFDEWYIELYEEYPCENKEELLKREGEVIRLIGNLNKEIAGRTQKEWYENNYDRLKEKQKQYNIENKEKRKEYQKQYNIENKEKRKEYKKQYRRKKKQEKDPIQI